MVVCGVVLATPVGVQGAVAPAPGVVEGVVPGSPGVVFVAVAVAVPGVHGVPEGTVLPVVQSTLEEPGVARALPRKLEDSASGLPLVFASPSQTRTTTRFMLATLVST